MPDIINPNPKPKAKRKAVTVDFYDREVFEGLEALALLARKKKSAYFREVLTQHYKSKRDKLK